MRKMSLVFPLLLFLLVGCAALGLETPATPESKALAIDATATAVNQTATMLLNAKKISSDDAQNVLDSTRAARRGVDVARSLAKVDPSAANAKLVAQQELLKVLQDYLKKKGG